MLEAVLFCSGLSARISQRIIMIPGSTTSTSFSFQSGDKGFYISSVNFDEKDCESDDR